VSRHRPDTLTLVIGLILAGFAILVLINLAGGAVLALSKVAAPLMLVAIGVVGIAVSQYRSRPRRHVGRRTHKSDQQHRTEE